MLLDKVDVKSWFWEPEPLPEIPERSRLYALQPVGIGTAQVESLTSYMSRLADAHSVSVRAMFNWDPRDPLDSILSKHLGLYSGEEDKNTGFIQHGHALNGHFQRTESWVAVLEQLTLIAGLDRLTMLPFKGLLGEALPLRVRRAWCPQCYDSDKDEGILYDRLIWCIQPISLCPVHHIRLVDSCPNCEKTSSHLAANVLPGYCARCGEWLGSRNTKQCEDGNHNEFEMFASSMTAELIGSTQAQLTAKNQDFYSCEALAANLVRCVEHLAGGTAKILADGVGMSYTVLQRWMNMRALPALDGLLKMAFALGVSLHKLFLASLLSQEDLEEMSIRSANRFRKPRTLYSADEIKEILLKELESDECRSVEALATSLGYASGASLQNVDLALCRQVSEKNKIQRKAHREYGWSTRQKYSNGRLESFLMEALSEECPPTAYEISIKLGYKGPGNIRRRLPELYHAVLKKRADYEESQRHLRRQLLKAAISETPPPTLPELHRRHGDSYSPFLLKKEADLVKELKEAAITYRRTRKEEIRKILEAASREDPPPTVLAIATRVGISEGYIREEYTELVRKVAQRAKKHKSNTLVMRRKELEKEVLTIVKDLNDAGIAPRYDCILSMLREGLLNKWDEVGNAIKKARRTLGLEPENSTSVPRKSKKSFDTTATRKTSDAGLLGKR